jgi:hypothetical protein
MWRRSAARSLWGRKILGSNPGIPTSLISR